MSERQTHDPVGILTSMAWERAKGELRSIVAAQGSTYGSEKDEQTGLMKFEQVRQVVEDFIKDFEEHEYHL